MVSQKIKEQSSTHKWGTSAAAGFLFALTLFLFGPLQIYLPNSEMFSYMLDKVLWKALPLSLLIGVMVTLLLVFLPEKYALRAKTTTLMLGISLLLWLQGNIILWNYGVLDGRDIPWKKLLFRGIIDGLIWFLVLLFILLKWQKLYQQIRPIAVFMLSMQLLFALFLLWQNPTALSAKRFTMLDENVRYHFSSQKNVFIIIVDGFQGDLFWEITEENPDFKKTFAGFTYYRNALSGFPLTIPSIPFILTGTPYDNRVPFEEYIEKVYFTASSIPHVLKQNGFTVDILMDAGRSLHKDQNLISNLKEEAVPLSNSQAGYLLDLTLFRYLPHFAKKVIFNNQNWRFKRYLRDKYDSNLVKLAQKINPRTGQQFSKRALTELYDVIFAAGIMGDGQITTDKNLFKFYHLKGIHAPFRMNEQLEYAEMNLSRKNWKKLAQGSLHLVEIILTELQRLHIYDQSMIFIIGDHGHSAGLFGLNERGAVVPNPAGLTSSGTVPGPIMSAGIPLILVKRFHEQGALKLSDSPVSLGDIPHTIFTELGIKGNFTGQDMFTLSPETPRTRYFSFFTYEPGKTVGKYLPPMKHFSITGHSWLPQSWQEIIPQENK